MAINKTDLSYKKLINKEFTEDSREFFQESTVSTFDINSQEVYTSIITSNTASMVTDGIAKQFTQFILTPDPTYPTNAWYFISGSGFTPGVGTYVGNTDKIQRNFISDKYGANYEIRLFDNAGSQIFKTDAINWYFDYKTGILHVADPGAYSTPYKVSVLQYSGVNLSGSLASISSSIGILTGSLTALSSSVSSGAGSKWTGSNPISRQSDVVITGSLTITNDLTVIGSASITFISQSTLNIGTNIVNVSTFSPSVRFGGLTVADSGSSPATSGSFLYDSQQDEFIFVHKGASATVTSSVFLLGPETYNSVGSETYLTQNRIPKGVGNEHLNDSSISDNGSVVSINSSTEVTGSLNVTQGVTGSLFGTSSWAVSASRAVTAASAVSASFAPNFSNTNLTFSGNRNHNTNKFNVEIKTSATGFDQFDGYFVLQPSSSRYGVNNAGYIQFVGITPGSPYMQLGTSFAAVLFDQNDNLNFPITPNTGSIKIQTGRVKITGSLNVSNGITGSLFGTASHVNLAAGPSITINKVGNTFEISGSSTAVAAGADKQIQFNSASAFAGTASFVFNYQSQSLQVGFNNVASGVYSTVIAGGNSRAKGPGDLAHGTGVVAWSDRDNPGNEEGAHAQGGFTLAVGNYAHAEGWYTTASFQSAHSEGEQTLAGGQGSHAEGNTTTALGDYSHTEGLLTRTDVGTSACHAEGYLSTASADYSHAEGGYSLGVQSFKGGHTTAAGSHAEGLVTQTAGLGSHAEGENTLASARASHAEGYFTTASSGGTHAHVEGNNTIAISPYQHVQGTFNIGISGSGAFIHGNGTSTAARRNLIYASGSQMQVTGSLVISGSITGSARVINNLTASYAMTASYYAGTVQDFGSEPISVVAATTVGLSAVYSNGSSGIGASLSGSSNGLLPTIDGITLTTADNVLIKDQTPALQNGVYDVVSVGSGATRWILSRSLAANETAEFDPQIVIPAQGTTQAGLIYAQTTDNPTIGTSQIVYTPTTTNQNVTQVTTGTQALYQIPWWTGTTRQLSRGVSNLTFDSANNAFRLSGSLLVSGSTAQNATLRAGTVSLLGNVALSGSTHTITGATTVNGATTMFASASTVTISGSTVVVQRERIRNTTLTTTNATRTDALTFIMAPDDCSTFEIYVTANSGSSTDHTALGGRLFAVAKYNLSAAAPSIMGVESSSYDDGFWLGLPPKFGFRAINLSTNVAFWVSGSANETISWNVVSKWV